MKNLLLSAKEIHNDLDYKTLNPLLDYKKIKEIYYGHP